jgi:hypothetical protein
VSKQKPTFHLLGDLSSTKTMCGLSWKKGLNQEDCYTLEVNHFLSGQWYAKHLVICPNCMAVLEKMIQDYHTKQPAGQNI